MVVLIATRASALAVVQAQLIGRSLARLDPPPDYELVKLHTTGDHLQEVSLEKVEGKGFFVDELERALADGRAHLAAHSLKDLPVDLSPGFELAAVLEREDPRDVLVSPHGGLMALPKGAVVGTDSSRRRAQLAVARPDLRFEPIRGNVPTRLGKLDAGGDFDALVLALAGLRRLGLEHRATEILDPDLCLPAPGQGALAVEALTASEWARLASRVNHAATWAAVTAERSFLGGLGGGCQAPVGALATVEGTRLRLRGVIFEGAEGHRVELEGPADDPVELGRRAAARVGGVIA